MTVPSAHRFVVFCGFGPTYLCCCRLQVAVASTVVASVGVPSVGVLTGALGFLGESPNIALTFLKGFPLNSLGF